MMLRLRLCAPQRAYTVTSGAGLLGWAGRTGGTSKPMLACPRPALLAL